MSIWKKNLTLSVLNQTLSVLDQTSVDRKGALVTHHREVVCAGRGSCSMQSERLRCNTSSTCGNLVTTLLALI